MSPTSLEPARGTSQAGRASGVGFLSLPAVDAAVEEALREALASL